MMMNFNNPPLPLGDGLIRRLRRSNHNEDWVEARTSGTVGTVGTVDYRYSAPPFSTLLFAFSPPIFYSEESYRLSVSYRTYRPLFVQNHTRQWFGCDFNRPHTDPNRPQPSPFSSWSSRRAALIKRLRQAAARSPPSVCRQCSAHPPSRQSRVANAWLVHLVSADHSMPEVSWANP